MKALRLFAVLLALVLVSGLVSAPFVSGGGSRTDADSSPTQQIFNLLAAPMLIIGMFLYFAALVCIVAALVCIAIILASPAFLIISLLNIFFGAFSSVSIINRHAKIIAGLSCLPLLFGTPIVIISLLDGFALILPIIILLIALFLVPYILLTISTYLFLPGPALLGSVVGTAMFLVYVIGILRGSESKPGSHAKRNAVFSVFFAAVFGAISIVLFNLVNENYLMRVIGSLLVFWPAASIVLLIYSRKKAASKDRRMYGLLQKTTPKKLMWISLVSIILGYIALSIGFWLGFMRLF